jgi:hypothetical protein
MIEHTVIETINENPTTTISAPDHAVVSGGPLTSGLGGEVAGLRHLPSDSRLPSDTCDVTTTHSP